MHKVALPKFDANIVQATLGAWHKSEGDPVAPGDVLVDVVTDKANFELTAEVSGTLRRIIAPEKSEIPLGYVVALVGERDEPLIDVSAENARMMEEFRASAAGAVRPVGNKGNGDSPSTAKGGTVPISPVPVFRATPRARRLAREHGIDLDALARSLGVDVITEEHVRKHILPPPSPSSEGRGSR